MGVFDDVKFELVDLSTEMLDTDFDTEVPESKSIEKEEKEVKQTEELDLFDTEEPIEGNEESDEDYPKEDKKEPVKKETKILENDFFSLNTVLKEKGVFSSDVVIEGETQDEQIESLVNNLEGEVEARINSWVDSLDPKLKDIFVAYEKGVPTEDLVKYYDDSITISKITDDQIDDDLEVARKVLLKDRMGRGLSKEEAEEEIDELTNIESHAKKALKRLKVQEDKFLKEQQIKADNEAKMYQQKQEEIRNTYLQKINDTTELIPGVSLTEKKRQRLIDSMFKPVTYDKDGRPVNKVMEARAKDPMKFEMVLHHLVDITNGFKDWKLLLEGSKTKVIRQIEETVANKHNTSGRASTIQRDGESEVVDAFKGLFRR